MKEQEKNLWVNAIFVFDTSALMNLYEYSSQTISDIFSSTFNDLNGRLWIPSNVSTEYIGNRHKPINKIKSEYEGLQNNIKNIENHIEQITNKTKSKEKHPFFETTENDEFNASFRNFKTKIEKEIETQNGFLSNIL